MNILFFAKVLFLSLFLISLNTQASISRTDLFHIIKGRTTLNDARINEVIELLKNQTQLANADDSFPIDGFLYASGMNVALLIDSDLWDFDIIIIDPKTKTSIKLPEMMEVDFENGGIKAELAYKWMFTFIVSGTTLDQLNGSTCGRGIGLVGEGGLGLEGSWLPCDRFKYGLLHVAIKAGLGAGLVFPKMHFRLKGID